jgi:hypothetical protein
VTTTEIVIVEGRKKLHTFGQSERGARIGARWEILTQPSARQRRKQGAALRQGGYSNDSDRAPTSRVRNDRRDAARSHGDIPGAPLTLNLGDGLPAVQHVKLVPIFDGLAAAADAGEELPAGIRAEGRTLFVESSVLRAYITRMR